MRIFIHNIAAAVFIMVIGVLALADPLEAAISLSGSVPEGSGCPNNTFSMTVTAPNTIYINFIGSSPPRNGNITLNGFTANTGGAYSAGQAIGGSSMGGITFSGATVSGSPWPQCYTIYTSVNQLCCEVDTDCDTFSDYSCVTFTEASVINSTAAGTATATAGPNKIDVSMPYTNDSNANNTYTVEYKLNTDSTWTSWVANASHVASPYATTITGLTGNVAYDIRATWNDADGVTGTNPQIISNVTPTFGNTTVGTATATQASGSSVTVSMPYTGDVNGNNSYTVDYKLHADSVWTNWVTNAAHAASPYTTTVSGLQPENSYDFRMTWSDPEGVSGTNPQTVSLYMTPDYTIAGGATATPGTTTISVSMPYTGDRNANNTYTVDYKLHADSVWTNRVTAAPHQASPYTITITGLAGGSIYDVRMTYNDAADTVHGTNPQTVLNIYIPINTTTAGTATADISEQTIAVSMPYSYDNNNNNSFTVEYKLSSSSTWTSWVANAPHIASPYTTTITGLTPGSTYDIRMTYTDPEGVTGTAVQTLTNLLALKNATLTGTATATMNGTTITAIMPYSGDLNANNTFTVEYKLSSDSLWTTWVTAAPHVPTPYTNAITGLTHGISYDVRLTYNDADGVYGTAQQLVSGVLDLTDWLNVTNLYVTEGGADNTILVVANFSGDANGNGSMTVQYKRSADSVWTAGPSGTRTTGRIYTTITGVTSDISYDVKVTFSDPDGLIGPSVITKSLTPRAYKVSPMLHNSLNASSPPRGPNWSGDPAYTDGWGLPGTKFGTMSCSTCHTQPTPNIEMVVTAIPDADARGYATNPVKYRGQNSNNKLGNDTNRDATVRRICEVCHTKTRVHRNDPSGQSWTNHQNNTGCLSCHPHDSGFKNRCYECHTGPGIFPATTYGVIP